MGAMLGIRLFGPLEHDRHVPPLPRDLGGMQASSSSRFFSSTVATRSPRSRSPTSSGVRRNRRTSAAARPCPNKRTPPAARQGLGLAGRVLLTEPRCLPLRSPAGRHRSRPVRYAGGPGRRRDLDEALALVRGEVLEDETAAAGRCLQGRYRERSSPVLLAAAGAALQDRDHAAAQRRAAAAIDQDPVRGHSYRLLMLACYTQGRQDEAGAFERCRRSACRGLGVDPLPPDTRLAHRHPSPRGPAGLIHSAADRSSPAVGVSSQRRTCRCSTAEELQALERGARAALASQ